MSNNLFVSYDLNSPNQDYEAVFEAIKSLGSWAKVHKSFWYVNSNKTAAEAVELVWKSMDSNDTLLVVDATNNNSSWQNLSAEVANHIKIQWVL